MHLIKQIAVSVAAFALATSLVYGAVQQAPESSTFTQIDVPGASSTSALGINPGGDIVGAYYDSSGSGHGFLLSNGAFTTIDVPGATFTSALGINSLGDIVGYYIESGNYHGYLLSNGAFTTVDVPGSIFTFALGINSLGDIVGYYDDGHAVLGFVLSSSNFDPNPIYTAHGDFTNMDFTFTTPSLTAGQGYIITVTADEGSSFDAIVTIKDPNGNIVVNAQDTGADETIHFSAEVTGQYTIVVMSFGGTMGPFTVNVYNGVTTIDVPGSSAFTTPSGINSLGDIVGTYYDSSFIRHSFLLSNGSFTTLEAPRGAQTFASGINRRSDIVGEIDRSGNPHGFLLRNGKYSVIAVPGAKQTSASGIDDQGSDIVGNFIDAGRNTHGFLLSR